VHDGLGSFVLLLHGHLPWVLHHGRWPHGEEWLFEIASECWLPLLDVLDRLTKDGIRPAWTLGLTPILLEQLDHPRFRSGFLAWLREREARAKADAKIPALKPLAEAHRARFAAQRRKFARTSIVRRFVKHANAGRIELWTSAATHAYLPLIASPRCVRAQIRAGIATSRAHGVRPKGAWLPECAYEPGIGRALADEGVRIVVVDAHHVAKGVPVAVRSGRTFRRLEAAAIHGDTTWTSPLSPFRVAEDRRTLRLTALARCPEVAAQVWSAATGYPGDPRYLEFHKREGLRGLRYWRVTGRDVDLGGKQLYEPDAAAAAIRDQADHFVRVVHGKLFEHYAHTGERGILTAPFDAELFGHWWSEGPAFLEAIARRMHMHPEVVPRTASEAVERRPATRAVALHPGSWGAGGDHRTWLDARAAHGREAEKHASERFLRLVDIGTEDPQARAMLEEAGRQLLLLQSSDWAFVIATGGAVDYGLRRIAEHAARLDDLLHGVEDRLAGRPPDPVSVAAMAYSQATDPVFPDLDLRWWI
jgi:1,4-alpha-glucan branching enzyme